MKTRNYYSITFPCAQHKWINAFSNMKIENKLTFCLQKCLVNQHFPWSISCPKVSFWPRKLTHNVSFYPQELFKWVSIIFGSVSANRNWHILTVSDPQSFFPIILANRKRIKTIWTWFRLCLNKKTFEQRLAQEILDSEADIMGEFWPLKLIECASFWPKNLNYGQEILYRILNF